MTTPVLLVAIAPNWIGTARIPRPLSLAGFEASLLARQGSLAEHSGYDTRLKRLPAVFTPLQWVLDFAAIVKERPPRLVIPCDDQAWILSRS